MEKDIINSFKTISEVENYRDTILEACKSRIDYLQTLTKAANLSEKNFGYIKECFEAMSPELFNLKEGKQILNKYTKTIKENKNLSSLHKIYETIRKAGKDTDVDFLMKSLPETKWDIDKKTVNEDVKKLGKILAEGYIMLGQEKADSILPKENTYLYKAVNYIAENQISKTNLLECSDAIKIIKSNILQKDGIKNVFESKDLDELANELLEEFNKKYSDSLSAEETNVLKEIASSEDRESIFNKYKASCIEKITEAKIKFEKNGDSNSSNRLASVMEQVNNKAYNLETIGEDVCNLIELSNIFE